jgi:hypothetical protein
VLPGASLYVKGKNKGTISKTNGSFSLAATVGDSVSISFVGYANKTIIITDCVLNIALAPFQKNIDEVVINADKLIAEEFSIRKISKIEIYTNPSAKADPLLAVNAMPSSTTTDESANISLRGGSPDETGIFLNDVPINDAVRYSQLNGIGTFSIFNTAMINSVQVYPGNPPLEYGNSASGIIALQTDEVIPSRNAATLSITLASIGGYASIKLDEQSSLTAFSNLQTAGLFVKLNEKALNSLKGFSSYDLGLHYFRQMKNHITLKVFNYSTSESYQYLYDQPTYLEIFNQRKFRNFTVANVRKQIGKTSLSINQGLSFSKANYDYSTLDFDLLLKDYFTSFNIHRSDEKMEWKTGFSYFHQATNSGGTFPLYSFAYGQQFPAYEFSQRMRLRTPEWYGYAKRYLGPFIIGGGLRKNLNVSPKLNYTSWQANAQYKPNNGWSFILSAGDYHKNILADGEQNNEALTSTRQYSFDGLYKQNNFEASASFFYKKGLRENIESKTLGVELFTRYKLSEELNLQLSLTSLDAEQKQGENKQPSKYNIGYFLRGNIAYKVQGTWTFTLVYLFREGSYYTPIESSFFNNDVGAYEPVYSTTASRLPEYGTLDVNVSKIFLLGNHTAIAFLSAGNIFNFKNVRDYSYNENYSSRSKELFSQRVIYFGLIINF